MEYIIASSASKILHINPNTINAYYNKMREKILQHSLKDQEKELSEFSPLWNTPDSRLAGKYRDLWAIKKGRGKAFVTVLETD